MSPRAWKYTFLVAIPVSLAMWYGIVRLVSNVWPFDTMA